LISCPIAYENAAICSNQQWTYAILNKKTEVLMIQQVTQFTDSELETIAQIWLQSNLDAHDFISAAHWQDFVLKDYRAHGIGKQLLQKVQAEHEKLTLNVYQKNTAAIAFYLKHGFTIVSEQLDSDTDEIENTMEWHR